MDDGDLRGLIEQVQCQLERVHASIAALDARMAHQDELLALRLAALERAQTDQETRLRSVSEAVIRLSTTAGLAQAAQAAFALLLSSIAAYLGRQ